MDKSKILGMGLGVGCLLLGAFGGWTFYQGMGLRADLATKQSALDQAQARIRQLEVDLKKAQARAAKAETDLAAASKEEGAPEGAAATADNGAAPAVGTSGLPSVTDSSGRKLDFNELFKGKAGDMIAKNAINMMYGDLFKEMTLNPQERDQLLKILVEGQTNSQRAIADQKEGSANAESFIDIQKVTQAKVKSLLGDDRFKQYETYQKEMPDRMQIKQFETSIGASANPLKDDQRKQMIQIMSEERKKHTKESAASGGNFGSSADAVVNFQQQLNQRVSNRLGTVLTPEQMGEFTKWQDSMTEMIRNFAPAAAEPTAAKAPAVQTPQ